MKIESIYLKNYSKLYHSNIKSIKIYPKKPIQLILGTNGSGKSSLLSQLNPSLVPVKTHFKKGIRKIEIYHNQSKYILTSNFNQKSKYHSFIKDGEELNPGGGADIQKELIEKYFNLDPLISSIISISLDWSILTPAIRKSHIYSLNPINIELLVDIHKNIRKKVSRFKNNISYLLDRKRNLSQQVLSKDNLNKLELEYKQLNQLKSDLTSFITYLHSLISSLSTSLSKLENENISSSNLDINSILYKIKYIRFNLKYQPYIPSYLSTLSYQLQSYNSDIQKIKKDIDNLISEIDQYKSHIKHMTHSDHKNQILTEILTIESNIKNTLENINTLYSLSDFHSKIYTNISKKDFQSKILSLNIDSIKESLYSNLLPLLSNLDNIITNYSKFKIINTNSLSKYHSKMENINFQINSIQSELSSISPSIKSLQSQLQHIQKPNIPDNCKNEKTFKSCSLYSSYLESKLNVSKQLKSLLNKKKKLSKKLNSYQKSLHILQSKYDFYKQGNEIYNKILNILNTFNIPFIKILSVIFKIDILTLLSSNPTQLIYYLNKAFDYITLIQRYFNLQNELSKYKDKLESIKTSNNYSKDFLEKILKNKESKLYNLQTKYKQLFSQISKLQSKYEIYSNIEKYINDLQSTYDNLSKSIEKTKLSKSIEFYEMIINECNIYLSEVMSKCEKIQSELDSQKYIQNRLKDEIEEPLKNIKQDKYIVEKIETILLKLISDSIKDFLVKWIELSNILLSKLCTYEFYLDIDPKNIDINFNFRLPVKIGDINVNDISECSSGQKDMLKLVMNIALIIILGYQDYPIFIDEIDRTLDEVHKTKLLDFLKYLLDNNIVSQIFLVNHHAVFYNGFDSDIIVLNSDNITCPNEYNTNVELM